MLKSTYGIDTGDLVTSRDYTNDRYFVRGDWQITEGHRLEATYQRLEENTVKPDDLFTGSSPQAIGANTFLNSGTVSNYYSGRLYSQWSDNFSTELRYSRSKIKDLQDPVGGGEGAGRQADPAHHRRRRQSAARLGARRPGSADGAVLAGPGTSRSANDLRTTVEQYRAVANLSLGDHKLKFGFELNRANLFNLFVQNATGTLAFKNVADLRQGLLSPGHRQQPDRHPGLQPHLRRDRRRVGNFSATGDVNDAAAAFTRSLYSAYVQDEMRISDQLNMVAGVRVDWYDGRGPEYNPVFANRYGIPNSTGFSNVPPVVLPRAAITYDFGDSSMFRSAQLRGGVGIFSGGDPLVWFGNAYQNDGSTFALGTTQAAGCTPASRARSTWSSTACSPACRPACWRARRRPAAAGAGNTQAVDPDITMPTVFRANLGFQTELNFAPSGFFSGWNVQPRLYLQPLSGFVHPGRSRAGDRLQQGPERLHHRWPSDLFVDRSAGDGLPGAPDRSGRSAGLLGPGEGFDLLQHGTRRRADAHQRGRVPQPQRVDPDQQAVRERPVHSWRLDLCGAGYAYTDSHDRRNMYNSTAGSNYGQTAAFDRQNPDASPGFYQTKHKFHAFDDLPERVLRRSRHDVGQSPSSRAGVGRIA